MNECTEWNGTKHVKARGKVKQGSFRLECASEKKSRGNDRLSSEYLCVASVSHRNAFHMRSTFSTVVLAVDTVHTDYMQPPQRNKSRSRVASIQQHQPERRMVDWTKFQDATTTKLAS
jgi:hypothetical protein